MRTLQSLDIVIPVYNEGDHLLGNIDTISKFIEKKSEIFFRFVLIDDGSVDSTWEVIEKVGEKHSVLGVRLSRNFGKEPALCAGLSQCDADAILVMDSDLQHPPEKILEFIEKWENGFDIIEGVKEKRNKESFLYRFCAHLFYHFFYKTSRIDLRNASDFRLFDRKVLEAWKMLPERITFFRGMSSWVGFSKSFISFEVQNRVGGTSKWNLLKLFSLAISAITSYTSAPLQIVTFLGIFCFLGGFLLSLQTIYMKIMGYALEGFTTVILIQLFSNSAILISLGIIGMYLSKIYQETKARPRYIVSSIFNSQKNKE